MLFVSWKFRHSNLNTGWKSALESLRSSVSVSVFGECVYTAVFLAVFINACTRPGRRNLCDSYRFTSDLFSIICFAGLSFAGGGKRRQMKPYHGYRSEYAQQRSRFVI